MNKSRNLKADITDMMANRKEMQARQVAALEQSQALAAAEHAAKMEELAKVSEHAAIIRALEVREKQLDIEMKQAQLDLLRKQLSQ